MVHCLSIGLPMKNYSRLSSAAVMIGTLRVDKTEKVFKTVICGSRDWRLKS